MIEKLSSDHAPDQTAFEDVEINLVGPNKPNTPRWESFGWSVPSDKEHTLFKDIARREDEEKRIFERAMAKLTPEEQDIVRAKIGRY